jgi:hypothetical protein
VSVALFDLLMPIINSFLRVESFSLPFPRLKKLAKFRRKTQNSGIILPFSRGTII